MSDSASKLLNGILSVERFLRRSHYKVNVLISHVNERNRMLYEILVILFLS